MKASLVRVGEVSDQLRGVSYGKADAVSAAQEGYLPVLRAGNITDSGLVFDDLVFVPRERISQKQRIKKGDVIIAASSGSLDVVGKAAMALEDCEAGFGAFCKVMRPNTTKVDSAYFAHYFQTREYRQKISSLAAGANINNLRNEHLDDLLIPLPPLPEQRRIAAILDQANALRAKRREALAELDQLTQSIFIEMFGDPVANSANWNKLPLAEVVTGKYGVKAGPFGSALKKEEYVSFGYRVYGQEQVIAGRFDIGDYYISERKYEQLKSCSITEGDLLVSLVGSFGKIIIVPSGIEPGIINPRLLKISPNQKILTSKFLAAVLKYPSVQKHFEQVAHGGTMGILNAGLLKQLDIILPPLHLQAAFANRLESAVQIALAHNKFLLELDSLFSSLQHRAFRGEL